MLDLEKYPILYVTCNGMYTCTIHTTSTSGISVTHALEFAVEGMYHEV